MQAITSAVLAAFVLYAGSWYFGMVEGNFALLLFMATVVTGAYWLAERFYFLPQRQNAAAALEAADIKRREDLGKMGISQVDGNISEAKNRIRTQTQQMMAGSILFFVWYHQMQTIILRSYNCPYHNSNILGV